MTVFVKTKDVQIKPLQSGNQLRKMGLFGRKKLLLGLSVFPSLELFNFVSVCCSVGSVVPSTAADKALFANSKAQTGALDPEKLKVPMDNGMSSVH